MDHALVKSVRQEVGDRLAEQRRADAAAGVPPMSPEDERQFARAVIAQVLEELARREIAAGRAPQTAEEEEALAAGVHAALFGVGRLQPLLDDPDIENIDVNGCDNVFVSYADGREVVGEPVADSDEELVELIQILGAYSGLSSRPFDTANPQLDLRLPDGSRLSAVMDVCRRPVVSIRRARLAKVFLSDLVGNGTLLPELASMLAAAVAARKNLMIAGSTNAGKTTLLRALANEIPPGERLVTVERALELGLDQFPELHPNVVAFEERLPNAEGAGGISMAELVRRSLRMNPSRVIVGEVLGDEIVTMLNAMTQGNDGSLSTIHANSAPEVFNRIATYALQAQERLPVEATHMLIAGAIDFVVFIEKRNEYAMGGSLRRFVSSVREVTGVDGRVVSSEVFTPGPDGRAVPRAGALAGAGLLLLVVAVRGREGGRAAAPPARGRLPPALAFLSRRGWQAAIAALLTLLVTRWPIAAVGAGLLTMTWHGLLGGAAEERLAIARIEALASWTESVRDTIAGAVGLEQAIPSSLRAAGQVMQDPLRLLVDRLRTRMPLPAALERFADELDDPVADLVVASLILNAKVRGPGLREVLTALSRSAREELDMRRRVIAQRRSTRRSVQIVVGVTLVMVAVLVLFNREYVEPYAAPEGQLVLVLVLAMFAAGFFWLKRLSGFEVPGRFLFGGTADARAGGGR